MTKVIEDILKNSKTIAMVGVSSLKIVVSKSENKIKTYNN